MTRVCVRYEALAEGHLKTDWAWFPSVDQALDHGTACKAFKLDPVRARFEWPRTARGAATQAHNGSEVSGFVFFAGVDSPIAKVTFARPNDKFRDVDPMSRADFERLGTTR